jgi:hypothetical protein
MLVRELHVNRIVLAAERIDAAANCIGQEDWHLTDTAPHPVS